MKQALLIVLFFTFSFAFSQDVSITYVLPATAAGGATIDAHYTLTKAPTMGSFAKFQLDLPAGFEAQSSEIKGGNFTFENNRVKIVWVSLPPDASFNFAFKITSSASAFGNITFSPQFFYLENNVKKQYDVTPYVINFGGTAAAAPDNSTTTSAAPPDASATSTNSTADSSTVAKTVEVASANNPTSTEAPPVSTPVSTEAVPAPTTIPTPEPAPVKPVATTKPAVVASSAKSGVLFHVQLAALTNKPSKSKFAQYGTVKIVEDSGLFKVLVGTFKTLEDARKYKAELISKGAAGCFVVGYENGVRVKI